MLAALVRCAPNMVEAVKKEMGLPVGKLLYTDKHGNETEMDVGGRAGRAGGKAFCYGEPVNEFHQLPPALRGVLHGVLEAARELPKETYAFVLAWLKGHLPPDVEGGGPTADAARPGEGGVLAGPARLPAPAAAAAAGLFSFLQTARS
jgi:hypothetical protein